MAKRDGDGGEGGGGAVAAAAELKEKLRGLVKMIVESDDYTVQTADDAIATLSALKLLKKNKARENRTASFSDKFDPPTEFRCPISTQLMTDPVILSTGQTYDRPFIQRWLNEEGHRTCPQTQQVLSHSILIPNFLVREMITKWCKDRGIEMPKPVRDVDEAVTKADRHRLNSLLHKLSLSLSDQKEAAKELRLLTKRIATFRTLFGESGVIARLLSPLSPGRTCADPDLHEDLITTVLNLSINDDNKKVLGEDPAVISLLIDALKSGTIQTRSNAAAAFFSISALDSNKHIIGKSGAIKHLIDLLDDGHPLAVKDAASAIFNICVMHENKGITVQEGAVRVIMNKIKDNIIVDELLAILALLSTHPKAVEEMGDLGPVPFLLGNIRETTSERSKENCVAMLYTICYNDRTKWKEIREDERVNGTLSKLAQCGTSRAKRKASGILERVNRFFSLTHTA